MTNPFKNPSAQYLEKKSQTLLSDYLITTYYLFYFHVLPDYIFEKQLVKMIYDLFLTCYFKQNSKISIIEEDIPDINYACIPKILIIFVGGLPPLPEPLPIQRGRIIYTLRLYLTR